MNSRWLAEQAILAVIATVVAVVALPFVPLDDRVQVDGWLGLSFTLPAGLALALIMYTALAFSLAMYSRRRRDLEMARVGIVLDPADGAEYNRMFDGFENCDFMAFNPPFRVEGEPGDASFDGAVETHLRRYRHGVRARYLFFDQASHDRALRFFGHVAKRYDGELGHVLQVRFVTTEDAPALTYFAGRRPSDIGRMAPAYLRRRLLSPAVILYPEELNESGYPEAVVVIDGAPDLYGIVRRRFQAWWNRAQRTELPRADRFESPPSAGP